MCHLHLYSVCFRRVLPKLTLSASRLTGVNEQVKQLQQKEPGPCGGFSTTYKCTSDYHGNLFLDEVAWVCEMFGISLWTQLLNFWSSWVDDSIPGDVCRYHLQNAHFLFFSHVLVFCNKVGIFVIDNFLINCLIDQQPHHENKNRQTWQHSFGVFKFSLLWTPWLTPVIDQM